MGKKWSSEVKKYIAYWKNNILHNDDFVSMGLQRTNIKIGLLLYTTKLKKDQAWVHFLPSR
jgi:phage terminase large subunit-like protein